MKNIAVITAIAVIFLAILAIGFVWFLKLSKKEKTSKVKEWTRFAVMEAEKYMGSSTGQIKLRWVYNEFIKRFPLVSHLVSFQTFSRWVDEALDWMVEQMSENDAVKEYIERD